MRDGHFRRATPKALRRATDLSSEAPSEGAKEDKCSEAPPEGAKEDATLPAESSSRTEPCGGSLPDGGWSPPLPAKRRPGRRTSTWAILMRRTMEFDVLGTV